MPLGHPSPDGDQASGTGPRGLAVNAAHLAVLSALGLAQPLFAVLRNNAEFFAIRGSKPVDIVVFALVVVAGPPLILMALELLAGLVSVALREWLHVIFVGVLSAIIAMVLVEKLGDPSSAVVLPIAVVLGVAAALVYAKANVARWLLTLLAPVPVLVLALFLLFSPVTRLVTGAGASVHLVKSRSTTPIVMIVFDEFPLSSLLDAHGAIDAARYPAFGALAHDSLWFDNVFATDAFTEVAVPAIETGTRPGAKQLPVLSDYPKNVFTLLGRGRRIHVQEAVTRLCPPELCHRAVPSFGARMSSLASDLSVVDGHVMLPRDLRHGLPAIDSSFQNFRGQGATPRAGQLVESQIGLAARLKLHVASDRVAVFRHWTAGLRAPHGPPALDFIHVLLPHVPWQYLPNGAAYAGGDTNLGLANETWADDQDVTLRGQQRHLLQVSLVDRLLGETLRRLKRVGLYDRALIVVTADHGVSFVPGQPRRALTRRNAPSILPVPLFVKLPGEHRAHLEPVHLQTLDILPTIASILHVRIPFHVDGHSAFSPGADRRTVTTTTGGQDPLTFDTAALDRRRPAVLSAKIGAFGTGADPARLFSIGPDRGLIGTPTARLAHVAPGTASAVIDQPSQFDRASTDSAALPVHLTARVDLNASVREIGVALDGRIAAVTPGFTAGGERRISVLLPPSWLHDGANRVEVLAINRQGRDVRVATLATAG